MNDEILKGFPISEFLRTEKSNNWNADTRRYYSNSLQDLLQFTHEYGEPTPELITQWESKLQKTYARSAVNVHLTAANNYFKWCGRYDLLRRHTKEKKNEKKTPTLTRIEYVKLLRAARSLDKHRTYLLVKLFATTNLPLQCLNQVTAELIRRGHGVLNHRGNVIEFSCPKSLQQELLDYMTLNGIYCGPVFITRGGKQLERPSIFRSMQELCRVAGVPEEKGNPRALRNLYKATQRNLERRLNVIKQQMYDQILSMEQDAAGWKNEDNTNWSA